MKTPECPGRGDCATCPFACGGPRTLVLETIASSSVFKERLIVDKVVNLQAYRIARGFSGGPVPEVQKESKCACGFCSECRKKKVAA